MIQFQALVGDRGLTLKSEVNRLLQFKQHDFLTKISDFILQLKSRQK